MFHKIINFVAFCIFFNTLSAQTCDVELLGYDPLTHQVSVVILNGENCGCNEYTQQDGNTCGDSNSTVVNNNEFVENLVFGIHYDGLYENAICTQANFHPGWAFAYATGNDDVGYTGDTLNFTLNTTFSFECVTTTPFEDYCWEFVVWQINLSQTAGPDDFPNEWWTDTCGTCANQTQMYPDVDLSNNSLTWCPDELPPPPLYPGCMDMEATNYDENAGYDDGTCEYPAVLGCTDPTACNYNQFATENDGSCATCDTPGAEEICNEYHNSDTYWEWYSGIFNCGEVETPLDMQVDSVWVADVSCDILNYGGCNPGIRWMTAFTNVGENPIDSWYFVREGPNGYTSTTGLFGVTNTPPYDQPLEPGESGFVLNTVTEDLVWQLGDTLCTTIMIEGGPDVNLENNTYCFAIPFEYPICIFGCMNPSALNYNPDATCPDDCEYQYGCTDETALNYDPEAIIDDGSCLFCETDTTYIEVPIYITDTLYITQIDTLYIELPPDTITVTEYEYVYITDTITEYITVVDTIQIEVIEYVYLTDTITEIQFIDCETGLPCEEEPGGPGLDGCWPWSIYIPNVMTPNNDNVNDVWKVIYDLNCWVDVEFKIFNRWGSMIYHGYGDDFDSYPYWNGSVNNGPSYVSDGVYTYTFYAKKWNSVEVFQKAGHITVLR